MKTVGNQLGEFSVMGVKPGALTYDDDSFEVLNHNSFVGDWKVIVFYPKDFTFVCPTEIVGYDALNDEFKARGTTLLIGSTDNEYCKIAWRNADPQLAKTNSWMFADTAHTLANDLGVHHASGVALRATVIVDPNNVIQHISVNGLNVGRNPDETLRILDALQTGEKTACSRPVGGGTL